MPVFPFAQFKSRVVHEYASQVDWKEATPSIFGMDWSAVIPFSL